MRKGHAMMRTIVYADGGCDPNPGPGGWGVVVAAQDGMVELCGGEPGTTTNNRMELTAPIMALETLNRPVTVHLHTDSTYVRGGITSWITGWQRNGWRTKAKTASLPATGQPRSGLREARKTRSARSSRSRCR